MDTTGTVQQPAYAGGQAGAVQTIPCVTPVRISTASAEKYKLATTFNMWETYTAQNETIEAGQVLSVNGIAYSIKVTGVYNYGHSPMLQLVLELKQ
jgi:hypothetical protein